MPSKYVDTNAIIQVIGCVYNNPSLLDNDDKYFISENDFPESFHKIIFGTIYKLHEMGVKNISLLNIEDYLNGRPKSKGVFTQYKGEEWLTKASEYSTISSFDYYYNRMKKFTLLRAYDNCGIDVSDIYDPDNILDLKKKSEQEEYLDNSTLLDIADKIDTKVDTIKNNYISTSFGNSYQAGENILDLIEDLKRTPEYGLPLFSYKNGYINTVTRGARKKKFYLRSAAAGMGKSRLMAADACFIACDEIYYQGQGWVKNGEKYPCLFITTELTYDEVQTMFLAFLSDVNEEKILNGKYRGDEEERVIHAAKILENSPLYIEELMDFSITDIENVIKKYNREYNVEYVMYDYIHSSLKILEEISSKTKGMPLREDNVLFMLSTKIKNLCNERDLFILSSTQLSSSWRESDTPDQNLLRGRKYFCALIYLILFIKRGLFY